MSDLQSYEVWRSVEGPAVTALLSQQAARVMQTYAQLSPVSQEAGGILIGTTRGDDIEVIEATSPLPLDKRSRTGFHRKDRGHFERATLLWKSNGREVGYVGEWHTHPEDHPKPSGLDRNQWQAVLTADMAPRVFVIVGRMDWLVMHASRHHNLALTRMFRVPRRDGLWGPVT